MLSFKLAIRISGRGGYIAFSKGMGILVTYFKCVDGEHFPTIESKGPVIPFLEDSNCCTMFLS